MSGILTKLWTALRGAANEAGEAAVDANATRILDQEIRDADGELRDARIALSEMMGKQSVEQNHLAEKRAKLEEYAGYIRQTLAKQKQAQSAGRSAEATQSAALAQEIAAKYAEQARVSVRNVRRDGLDVLKKQEKDGTITQDQHRKLDKDIQALTDATVKRVDDLLAQKDKEILQV